LFQVNTSYHIFLHMSKETKIWPFSYTNIGKERGKTAVDQKISKKTAILFLLLLLGQGEETERAMLVLLLALLMV